MGDGRQILGSSIYHSRRLDCLSHLFDQLTDLLASSLLCLLVLGARTGPTTALAHEDKQSKVKRRLTTNFKNSLINKN